MSLVTVIASSDIQRCSAAEWDVFRKMVAHGMLYEVVEWIDQGKPTLRPENKHTSAFEAALLAPNLSMTQVLWERAWQERREAVRALGILAWQRTSDVVMRYLLENGCPVDHVSGSDLCMFHDLEMVKIGMNRGISLLEPDGWATAFVRVGSRPLIRLYLEQKDNLPELRKDAVRALCQCIAESRLRATALLRWAGVDPLGKAPRYYDMDDADEEWDSFPAINLANAEKAGELLKLLKPKPTTEQWFELLEATVLGKGEVMEEILALRKDPDAVFLENGERSSVLLRDLLFSICWRWSWLPSRDERIAKFCIRLLELGVQLMWEDKDNASGLRREIYRSSNRTHIFKVLAVAAERGGEDTRIALAELVRVPKMRELVIKQAPMILTHLATPKAASRGNADIGMSPSVTKGIPIARPTHAKQATSGRRAGGYRGGRVLTRKEIYSDVWAAATMHVAKGYGISGSMLARICTQLKIPRPPRGYWARPANARKGMKPPLPPWKGEQEATWAINPANVKAQKQKRT
jgi:hypothetical protein